MYSIMYYYTKKLCQICVSHVILLFRANWEKIRRFPYTRTGRRVPTGDSRVRIRILWDTILFAVVSESFQIFTRPFSVHNNFHISRRIHHYYKIITVFFSFLYKPHNTVYNNIISQIIFLFLFLFLRKPK